MDYDPRKKPKLENSRIDYFEKLTIPEILKGEIPITEFIKDNVKEYREIISNILQGRDNHLCSYLLLSIFLQQPLHASSCIHRDEDTQSIQLWLAYCLG